MSNRPDESQIPYHTSSSSNLDWKSLDQIITHTEDREPMIPASVIAHFMAKAGCNVDDPNVLKLMSASTHKYLADILKTATEFRAFAAQDESKSASLTNQALTYALRSKGVELQKPQYLLDDVPQ